MNYLIELGRKAFHEFNAEKGYSTATKFSKSGGKAELRKYNHYDDKKVKRYRDLTDKEKNEIVPGKGGATLGGAAVGAAGGAAGGAGVLKARQKVLNRQVGERRVEVRRKTKLRKGAQKTLIDGKWVPNPSSKYIERARMRAKHGKDWWKKDKSSVFAGKNRKVLGYGALAGAALGGIAGHLSRGKKKD